MKEWECFYCKDSCNSECDCGCHESRKSPRPKKKRLVTTDRFITRMLIAIGRKVGMTGEEMESLMYER